MLPGVSERYAQMGYRIWMTKDGTTSTWVRMTTSHLRNVANMLERRVLANVTAEIDAAYGMLQMLRGEMAIDAVDHGLLQLQEAEAEIRQLIDDMRNYADWRDGI